MKQTTITSFHTDGKITVKINEEEVKVFQHNDYYSYEDNYLSYHIYKKNKDLSLARFDITNNNDLVIIVWNKKIPKRLLKEVTNHIKTNHDIKTIIFQDKCFNTIEDLF